MTNTEKNYEETPDENDMYWYHFNNVGQKLYIGI